MGNGFVTRMRKWAEQPFSQQMDLMNWVLFVGLVVTVAFLWCKVLNSIEEI